MLSVFNVQTVFGKNSFQLHPLLHCCIKTALVALSVCLINWHTNTAV